MSLTAWVCMSTSAVWAVPCTKVHHTSWQSCAIVSFRRGALSILTAVRIESAFRPATTADIEARFDTAWEKCRWYRGCLEMFLCSSQQGRSQMTGRRLPRRWMTGFWVMLRSGERCQSLAVPGLSLCNPPADTLIAPSSTHAPCAYSRTAVRQTAISSCRSRMQVSHWEQSFAGCT